MNLTVKINCEILAEYESYVVLAMFIDGKFSKVLTVNIDED